MIQKQRVGIAEILIAKAPEVLISYGLGSCLGIVLYDPDNHLGGLAHTLLPEPLKGMATDRPGKFVTTAVRFLRDELVAAGADPKRLVAKLCGGSRMFQLTSSIGTIGDRNVEAARAELVHLDIPLVAEDVGGNQGRTCEFHLADGKVLVRLARGRDKLREL